MEKEHHGMYNYFKASYKLEWEWRNEAVFNQTMLPIQAKVSWIRSQVEEINIAFARTKSLQNTFYLFIIISRD